MGPLKCTQLSTLDRQHVQVRLMSQFGSSGCIQWLRDSDGEFCFACKQDVESVTHFLLDCSYFKQNFLSLWRNLKLKSQCPMKPMELTYVSLLII